MNSHPHEGPFPPFHLLVRRQAFDPPSGASVDDKRQQEFTVTFEQLLSVWSDWRRMFLEPDGSFLWAGGEGSRSWQIDGQVHDGRSGIVAVEMWGAAPKSAIDALVEVLRVDRTSLCWHWPRHGIEWSDAQFRESPWRDVP